MPPLAKLCTMVKELAGAKVVSGKQLLEYLVGHLVHADTVFPWAKPFSMHSAAQAASKPGQTCHLNLAARSELARWDLQSIGQVHQYTSSCS